MEAVQAKREADPHASQTYPQERAAAEERYRAALAPTHEIYSANGNTTTEICPRQLASPFPDISEMREHDPEAAFLATAPRTEVWTPFCPYDAD